MEDKRLLGLFVTSLCLSVSYTAPSWQRPPVCRSYNKLCRVSFDIDYGVGVFVPTTSSEICACPPGLGSCPSQDDSSRVVQMHLMSSGQNFQVTLNYCGRQFIPRYTCQEGQVAATFKGFGAFLFEMEGELRCRCPGPLYLSSASPARSGESIRRYTCGQPTCQVNRSIQPVCERTRPSQYPGEFVTEILCGCPDGFECRSDTLAIFGSPSQPEELHCQPTMVLN